MAHDSNTKAAVLHQIEDIKREGLSARKAIRRVHEKTGIPISTINYWLYRGPRQGKGKHLDQQQLWEQAALQMDGITRQLTRHGKPPLPPESRKRVIVALFNLQTILAEKTGVDLM
jgi:hypothetical protein